jgi:hypothetical protein
MSVDILPALWQAVRGEIFDYTLLMGVLRGYAKPRDVVTRLLQRKQIIRVKKGLYVFGEFYRQELLRHEPLANLTFVLFANVLSRI